VVGDFATTGVQPNATGGSLMMFAACQFARSWATTARDRGRAAS
jgi:hypothetical protein